MMSHAAVQDRLATPRDGIRLVGGPLQTAFANNIAYVKGLSQDAILYWFRVKAGLPAPGEPYRGHFEDNIKGQTAGLFLMGAANTLRWQEDAEVWARVDEIPECIDVGKDPDGYFMAVPREEFGTKEYPNYVRAWLNYGLVAAHQAGNRRALALLRGMQDWFNRCDERALAKDLLLGYQGMVASTTVHFSPAGVPADLATAIEAYQENWWLDQFIRGYPGAVHEHPDPHGTELTAVEAYLDVYRATGKPMYLNAVQAAYQMYKASWQHVGGGIVMCENTEMYPGSYWLDPVHKYNELCCSAFWIYLNQRLHRLWPDEERYVGEIEVSLYNVLLAAQAGPGYIRYHAYLDRHKDGAHRGPTCCAGHGARLYASLPEFLFSLRPGGLSVDIYAPPAITWDPDGGPVSLRVETGLPLDGAVTLTLSAARPQRVALALLILAWATGPVPVCVDGQAVAEGAPGTYLLLDRLWQDGDWVTLGLPLDVRTSWYTGADGVDDYERYAFTHGPLLVGVAGPPDATGHIRLDGDPARPAGWLQPHHGQPGYFGVAGRPDLTVMPYHAIEDEPFTCYPLFARPG